MKHSLPAQYVDHQIRTIDQLESHYKAPVPASLFKELEHISDHYRTFIEKAPFLVIASSGNGGLDCTPRGDPAGFVRVIDKHTVLMPDRRGNNRLDTLRNLVEDPRVSVLFLIPGVGETLRINGHAFILTEPELCQSFEIKGKIPASVVMIKVDRIYFQCQKALARSKLWDADTQVPRSDLPSTGEMLQALKADFDGGAYDRDYPERLKKTIY